jgi:hypothetical protein
MHLEEGFGVFGRSFSDRLEHEPVFDVRDASGSRCLVVEIVTRSGVQSANPRIRG